MQTGRRFVWMFLSISIGLGLVGLVIWPIGAQIASKANGPARLDVVEAATSSQSPVPAQWASVGPGSNQSSVIDAAAQVAYVYKSDVVTANNFKGFLEGSGYAVALVPLDIVTSTNFSTFDMTIIADDTGRLDNWGTGLEQITPIMSANKPILGLGRGGYAFFGKLGSGMGWPHGWQGLLDSVTEAPTAPATFYSTPNDLTGRLPGPFQIYTAAVDEIGIYLPSNPGVQPIGLEPPFPNQKPADHAPLVSDFNAQLQLFGCYELWGYAGGPDQMNSDGKMLFLNAMAYGLTGQCQTPSPPPEEPCVVVTKSSVPPDGSPVSPGDIITYTLNYTIGQDASCVAYHADLIDPIPADTMYVPGSATGGGFYFMGTAMWNLGDLLPGATGTQSFRVNVLESQCNGQRTVEDTARLNSTLGVFYSNMVAHPVTCPPVTFPNTQPPYAEDEVEVYPYPLVAGHATQLSVRVRNLLTTTQVVTVSFQADPDRFGIGLSFTTLAVPGSLRVVTLPPGGIDYVRLDWTPVSSGQYSIQVKVEGAGFAPIYTQHNLDVAEDLRPGVGNVLTFTVGNPTSSPGDIELVVYNTCPGWTASVSPTQLLSVGPTDTDLRTAELNVTPPTGVPLGTGCYIDVQGWMDGRMIGGIRKLDVPPVKLPASSPPWEEKEISVRPDPPVAGQIISYSVELQNPLPATHTVELVYSYADFGAGIGFTPIQTRTIDLPPDSIANYSINWASPVTGSLHFCLQTTLKQSGFSDQRSQRNIDFLHPVNGFAGLSIPFRFGNPDPFTRTLRIDSVLVGIDSSAWVPHITPDPPPYLGATEVGTGTLLLTPAPGLRPAGTALASNGFGDAERVEVSVYLDDVLVSGFTVDLTPIRVYLPIVMRQY